MLTVQILINNPEQEISHCLESLFAILPSRNIEIIVGDLGVSHIAIQQCKEYKATLVPVKFGDFSKIRNQLVKQSKNKWQLWLEPEEVIVQGDILAQIKNRATIFSVIQGDCLTRQVRLWRDGSFINPVFERVDLEGTSSDCVIVSSGSMLTGKEEETIKQWIDRCPTLASPYYYQAYMSFANRKYNDFIKNANIYLFKELDINSEMPMVMTRYNLANVYCYNKKDAATAIQQLAPCLLKKPLMAEFWCLMGDIHYFILDKYDKAIEFYENAILLGSRRLIDDPYPMEISKYKEYPEKMINHLVGK